MSKNLIAAFILAACLSLNCFGETNLIANPGFEDSNSAAWAGRGAVLAITTDQFHSGAQCAKASDRTASWQGIKQSVLGKLKAGETYKFSGWAKLDNAVSATVTISMEVKDDQGTKYHNIAKATVTDSNWVEISGKWTFSPMGTPSVLDLYFEGPPANVNFFVDDISVVSGSEVPAAQPVKPAEPNAAAK